jgi:hypothetical protein
VFLQSPSSSQVDRDIGSFFYVTESSYSPEELVYTPNGVILAISSITSLPLAVSQAYSHECIEGRFSEVGLRISSGEDTSTRNLMTYRIGASNTSVPVYTSHACSLKVGAFLCSHYRLECAHDTSLSSPKILHRHPTREKDDLCSQRTARTLIAAALATTANAWRALRPSTPFTKGVDILIKTVRLNHLRAALLAVAATGLLAAVGLVVLYVQPAEANYPGKPGKIAFAGYESNDSEIYTINPNGGGKLNVTDNTSDDYNSDYAPNGKRIAYVNDAGADREIYTIKPNGGGKHQVIDNSTANFNPYWGVNSDSFLRRYQED